MKPLWISLAAALCAIMFSLGMLVVRAQDLQRIDARATQAHAALCALHSDLERRVRNTEAFLVRHPDGIPGIPRAEFERSLQGQRDTLAALSPLNCP